MTLRILVVDDHKMFREGILALLREQEGMEVVGEAQDGQEAIRMVKTANPDVVIMDVAMNGTNGVEATAGILKNNPAIKIIAVSMHADRHFVTGMLEAGASGYLIKGCAFEELMLAIQAVMDDRTYLSPAVAKVVVDNYVRKAPPGFQAGSAVITPREREVLQHLAEGKSTKEIASLMHVSSKTIETHRKNMMEKLKLYSIAELTKYAILEGFTSLHVK